MDGRPGPHPTTGALQPRENHFSKVNAKDGAEDPKSGDPDRRTRRTRLFTVLGGLGALFQHFAVPDGAFASVIGQFKILG
jgi:hypothetical protein